MKTTCRSSLFSPGAVGDAVSARLRDPPDAAMGTIESRLGLATMRLDAAGGVAESGGGLLATRAGSPSTAATVKRSAAEAAARSANERREMVMVAPDCRKEHTANYALSWKASAGTEGCPDQNSASSSSTASGSAFAASIHSTISGDVMIRST